MSGGWKSSNRSSRLPSDWQQRVEHTCDRAHGLCESDDHVPECDGLGAECDHHEAGDDHSLENLRWLNHHCHRAKTQREALDAYQVQYAGLRRQPEQRPGA